MKSLYPQGSLISVVVSDTRDYLSNIQRVKNSKKCYTGNTNCYDKGYIEEREVEVTEYILYDDVVDLLDVMRILKMDSTVIIRDNLSDIYLIKDPVKPDLLSQDLLYDDKGGNIISLVVHDCLFKRGTTRKMGLKEFYKEYIEEE